MSSSFQTLFTPIFIIITLVIFLGGIVLMQFLDRLFAGSKNINAIRMFFLALIINIIILVFLIMSFSKVKLTPGPAGPQGNKGYRGGEGMAGGLNVCGQKYQTVAEKKAFEKSINYLDLKPPVLEMD
jgi:hypothetical protein